MWLLSKREDYAAAFEAAFFRANRNNEAVAIMGLFIYSE
jgi:hypothetical protein